MTDERVLKAYIKQKYDIKVKSIVGGHYYLLKKVPVGGGYDGFKWELSTNIIFNDLSAVIDYLTKKDGK